MPTIKKYFSWVMLASLVLTACADNSSSKESLSDSLENKKQEQQVTASVTITNASWPGTYSGTVPCANCPGILTELTLLADNTFELKQVYEDEKKSETKNQGNFTWMPDSMGIELQGLKEMPTKFLMQEKQLVMLNREGKAVEGEKADLYILKKIQ